MTSLRDAPRVNQPLRPPQRRSARAGNAGGPAWPSFTGTADVVGRLAVLAGRSLGPGETGYVQVDLAEPIAALYGDRAVLRDHGARLTLAGGRIMDPFPPRRGRRLPARLAFLEAASEADPVQALRRLLEVEGLVDLPHFALVRNLVPAELDSLTVPGEFLRIGPASAALAVTHDRLAALSGEIVTALAAFHAAHPEALGPTRPALAARLRPLAPEAALEAALADLAASSRAVREGPFWRLPDHRPRLVPAEEKLWQRVRPMLEVADLRPPRVREIAADLALEPERVERLLERAKRLGRVARVADNRFFLPETLARLAEIARELADDSPEGTFTAAAFKDRSGVGRNLTIQILEYLDKIGATRRRGDARILLHGSDAFG